MIDSHFAILGSLVLIAGGAGYALDTLRGNTQPNRISWFLWALVPMIAFAAELAQGVGTQTLLSLAVGVGPMLVLAASFVDPRAYWKLTVLDVVCGLLSVAALASWAVTDQGDVAIWLAIVADLFAAIPTARKAHRHPRSESAKAYIAGALGAGITLLTIQPHSWSFASYGFPLYVGLMSSLIGGLILIRRPRMASVVGAEREPA